MTPWLLLTVLVALVNLTALHVVRGRWSRVSWVLLLASLAGTAAGDAVGRATHVDALRLGDYQVLTASLGAQLTMLVVLLIAALLPGPGSDD
jgi:4-hydroxybenzoate polyprenyltransferase